jgi:Cd(II)/Pb(II)-responsive transcriptional regulator
MNGIIRNHEVTIGSSDFKDFGNMKIGELAKRARCTVEVVRFYEGERILPQPQRQENGYRFYQDEHLQRLAFVRRCRDLDMSLKDVARLLEFADDPRSHCDEVNALVDMQIQKVEIKLSEIKTLQKQLKNLRRQCNGETLECGILQELNHAQIKA